MERLVHMVLKYLWVIRTYKDKKGVKLWIFNFYNPIGWMLLIVWSIGVGVVEGVAACLYTIAETVKDSKNP